MFDRVKQFLGLQEKSRVITVDSLLREAWGSADAFTGTYAVQVSAVFACCRVIAEDIAKLPARLVREEDGQARVAADQPEYMLLSSIGKATNEIDDGFTAMEWIELVLFSAALSGRGVAHLNRVGGIVREVTPIPDARWQCLNRTWRITFDGQTWETVPRNELLVLRGPVLGTNITNQARTAIDLASRINRFLVSISKKAGRPNGILSLESGLSPEQAKLFQELINDTFGPDAEGGMLPIDLGKFTYERLSLTPEEMNADATYKRAITEIAAAFRVQPARIMHEMAQQTHASAYQWNISHVTDCIQPWAKRFEQVFTKDVLGDRARLGYRAAFDLKGLLQANPKDRGEFYLRMRTAGAMSPRAVAEMEGLPTDGLSDDPAFPLLTNPLPAATSETPNDA